MFTDPKQYALQLIKYCDTEDQAYSFLAQAMTEYKAPKAFWRDTLKEMIFWFEEQ